MKRLIFISLVAINLISCNKIDFVGIFVSTSPTADSRFADSMKLNPSGFAKRIESSTDEYRLFVCSDLHINGSTDNLDRFCSDCLGDPEGITAILCLGDISGGRDQYKLIEDHISGIKNRMYFTAGNHDLLWGEWNNFLKHFGSSSYLLEICTPSGAKDLFISIDSASNNIGKDQTDWLESTVFGKITKEETYRNIVIFTHCCFNIQNAALNMAGTIPMDQTILLGKLFADNSVDLVLTGHLHIREEDSFKAVKYVILDSMEDGNRNASYSVLHIGNDIREEVIRF